MGLDEKSDVSIKLLVSAIHQPSGDGTRTGGVGLVFLAGNPTATSIYLPVIGVFAYTINRFKNDCLDILVQHRGLCARSTQINTVDNHMAHSSWRNCGFHSGVSA